MPCHLTVTTNHHCHHWYFCCCCCCCCCYRPTIFDPSELRTDVTGKVVRYLQDNGAEVGEGQPYVEVEAMKMIMPLKATETGKINHNLSPGSVISAGDLLASLELKDPSKVKKILNFDSSLDIPAATLETDAKTDVTNILAGFKGDPDAAAQLLMDGVTDAEEAAATITEVLSEFVRVESIFANKLKDDVVRDLTKANTESLDVVIAENQAHQQLAMRSKLVLAMLRQVETFFDRFGATDIPDTLKEVLTTLAGMKEKVYGEIALAADSIVRQSSVPAFSSRIEDLRAKLLESSTDLEALAKSATLSAGVDLLTSLFDDDEESVRAAAIEVYIRRVYRAHKIIDLSVKEMNGRMTCFWTFTFANVKAEDSIPRYGMLSVVPTLEGLDIDSILDDYTTGLPESGAAEQGPLNMLHIASTCTSELDVDRLEGVITGEERKLNMLGVRTVGVMVPVEAKDPAYYSFPQCDGYKEDPLRRNMRPTFHYILELARLTENFSLERIPSIGRNVQVYIGSEKTSRPARGGPPQVLFVRGISHTAGITTDTGALRTLVAGLDELERAQANKKVNMQSSSRIFVHSMYEVEGTTAAELFTKFENIIGKLKSQLATRLLKLRVDEIEVKIRLKNGDDIQTVRLVASSMEGEWLKASAYIERADPASGVTKEFCVIDEKEDFPVCYLDLYSSSNVIQTKRAVARRVGSTYAYDFLGLMEVGLIDEWNKYTDSLGPETTVEMPTSIFKSTELIEDDSGALVPGSRQIGTNKVGMVAWQVTMKTPEYPEGREVVVIANDVTVQSGSFGVEEDELYYKASKYAREAGLPRLYIACNAGARIGLVDELKPKIKIKFFDEQNPSKGFEYLYLTDEDYTALPEGTVIAEKVEEGWALSDVIGTNHGIGVENLQGSGKIAGETSQAYDEIFTLSYVTGRSVGIGAYLVRLGQRVIQMKQGPLLLTGFSALNKLLGREVYNSQDQLGGPQIMIPNGVSHEMVDNDQEGVASMLKWLSFVPKDTKSLPATRESGDPVDRDVVWKPTPTPYDPRLMLSGTADMPGFFDKGTYKEYLAGWGKSVVVGRGRLGGIPMGAIAVETRLVDKVIPADPADANSREAILPQAGQVLFPDSSYKTAQAIRDFNKEGLPIMIFANWRGFSGGMKGM